VGVATELDSDRWDAWEPAEAARRLAGMEAPWYVAAGWAIDLFLGGKRREHEDLEIAIPAASLGEFVDALAGFEIYAVRVPGKGIFTPLAQAGPGLVETHQTWVRDPESGDWKLDLFREPSEGDTWICRRDESIRLPFSEAIRFTEDGIPFGRPELVLLFKARHSAQDKNQADFAATLPRLDSDERERLAGWIELVHPGHEWLAALRG
jgi:hypothetical protein